MATGQGSDYYQRQSGKLLRRFDWFARRAQAHMEKRHEPEFARQVLADARKRFEGLLPDLPYIGGLANPFTPVIEVNGWIIALYWAFLDRGSQAEEAIRVLIEVADEVFASMPGFVRRLAGRFAFAWPVRSYLTRAARRSQLRRHPADFVWEVREREDGISLVFEECAVHKLYRELDVKELGPYCNFFDVTYSRHLGMGLDASQTKGLGCDVCTLQFRKGQPTPVPPLLEGFFRELPNS
ncbi:MAG: L-2-amino-thiazoline-4-carboxylic acid hydrolase [bacterium]|nr:L-2-amino-thiazoline-4-carboxylic acid hydrolase [bacterium]